MLMDTRPARGGEDRPWEREPDRVAWRDPATGYQCLILRHPAWLSLCGYVRVPRGHALHGRYYDSHRLRRVHVHGGLTFSGCMRSRRMKRGHWFGFDCAHYMDILPAMELRFSSLMGSIASSGGSYRTVDYVREQCTVLARQLAERATR